jgi:hypothetical protein
MSNKTKSGLYDLSDEDANKNSNKSTVYIANMDPHQNNKSKTKVDQNFTINENSNENQKEKKESSWKEKIFKGALWFFALGLAFQIIPGLVVVGLMGYGLLKAWQNRQFLKEKSKQAFKGLKNFFTGRKNRKQEPKQDKGLDKTLDKTLEELGIGKNSKEKNQPSPRIQPNPAFKPEHNVVVSIPEDKNHKENMPVNPEKEKNKENVFVIPDESKNRANASVQPDKKEKNKENVFVIPDESKNQENGSVQPDEKEKNKENVFVIPDEYNKKDKKEEVDAKDHAKVETHHVPDKVMDRENRKAADFDKDKKTPDGKEKVDVKTSDYIEYLTLGDRGLLKELSKEFFNQLEQKASDPSGPHSKINIRTLYYEVFPNPMKKDLTDVWSKIMNESHVKYGVKKEAKELLNQSILALTNQNLGNKRFSDMKDRLDGLKINAMDSNGDQRTKTKSKENNGFGVDFKNVG